MASPAAASLVSPENFVKTTSMIVLPILVSTANVLMVSNLINVFVLPVGSVKIAILIYDAIRTLARMEVCVGLLLMNQIFTVIVRMIGRDRCVQ